MALQFWHGFLLTLVGSVTFLCACQAQDKDTSLLSQMQELEAQESQTLFAQAVTAADNDKVEEAQSLVKQALGRGAGSAGLDEANLAIAAAEKRIAERIARQKRLAAQKRESAWREEEAQSRNADNSSSSSSSSNSRPSGLKRIDGVTTGTGSYDTYNAYCLDGTYTSVTVDYNVSSDPIICSSNSYRSALCKRSSEWSINDAGKYGCQR